MKKGVIIGIIAVVIIAAGGYFGYSSMHKTSTSNAVEQKTVSQTTTSPTKNTTKVTEQAKFSQEDTQNYYKLSQNVGDIGLPSASMTTNLEAGKTINGVTYYSTYSYDTRAAYNNDTSKPTGGNYSHLVSQKIVSLNGQSISNSEFGTIDTSKLSSSEIESQVYKIASMYVEGYTANNPNLVVNANDNYEGDLNAQPPMTVNLNNIKEASGMKLYQVEVDVNGYKTPIYVGLDGYIFVSSQTDFYQLFFPNKLTSN